MEAPVHVILKIFKNIETVEVSLEIFFPPDQPETAESSAHLLHVWWGRQGLAMWTKLASCSAPALVSWELGLQAYTTYTPALLFLR
jgi:hypothetical protein